MNHQAGIFREGTSHHVFLEFAWRDRELRDLPSRLPAAALAGDVTQVVAFGARLARAVAGLPVPPQAADFEAVAGADGFSAPATQQDLFVWLHGEERDELFAAALAWRDALAPLADVAQENHGFRFRDSRDLTGFVDGTANPKGDARLVAALIDAGDCGGGSFVMAQRWVHDLPAFAALPEAAQERVFGRTKADSVELVGDAMPPDSHVSRTDLPGVKIYRRSSPAGGVRDAGLFFLAFSASIDRFHTLLASMFGRSADGRRDRMLSYTRPVTGSFYYAPPASALATVFG